MLLPIHIYFYPYLVSINGDKVIGKITLNELIPYKFSEDSTYRALSSENFAKGKV